LIWRNSSITDLGILGGTALSIASAINNRGEIAGQSDVSGDTTFHALLWRNGVMTDLGTLPGDFSSNGLDIESKTQIIGVSSDINGNQRGFLWQRGVMIDLNNLIPAGSPWFLFEVDSINSRGEIAGGAFNTTTSENRTVLLTPCDEHHSGEEGCDYDFDRRCDRGTKCGTSLRSQRNAALAAVAVEKSVSHPRPAIAERVVSAVWMRQGENYEMPKNGRPADLFCLCPSGLSAHSVEP
jgi:probable HAF family extracellular repeat protein